MQINCKIKEIILLNKLHKLSDGALFPFSKKKTFHMTEIGRKIDENATGKGYVRKFLEKCREENILKFSHEETIQGQKAIFYTIQKKEIEKSIRKFIDDNEIGKQLLDFIGKAKDTTIIKL